MRILFALFFFLILSTITAADARHARHHARLYATPYDHPAAAAGLYVTARPLVWFAENVCSFVAWSVAGLATGVASAVARPVSGASAAAADRRHAILMIAAAALVVASVSLTELHLVLFHSVDGHEVAINPAQVTTMYAAKDDEQNKLFVDSVRCVIGLTDGKFVTVVENCNVVKRLLEENTK